MRAGPRTGNVRRDSPERYAMGKGKKRLCKWNKDDFKADLDKLKEIVAPGRYVCRKCGRVANDCEYLCKPESLHSTE